MQSFLKQTAEYIYNKFFNNFENSLIIFPNHRTEIFFLEQLKDINKKNIWLPKMLTISEFLEQESNLFLAEPIELISILYKTYTKISPLKESFDDFYFWGDMMLKDFNDIDKFLVNAKSIFKNLKNLKNIDEFDYLTPNQKDVLSRFFEEFDPKKPTELKQEFQKIWNLLLPIYEDFNKVLKQQKIAYDGMIYKEAVKAIENKDIDNKTYIFVGFNAITPCEEKIFKILINRKQAYFFWDYDKYYINNKIFKAGNFIREHLQNFPSPNDFKLQDKNLTTEKNIKIVSTSTQTGQVHYMGNWLDKNKQTDYTKTAIVLADEKLLETTLNYLPDNINDINITMGYPIKNTLVGSLISMIINLHNTNISNNTFYYKKVINILQHPYIKSIYTNDAENMVNKINSEFIFNLESKDFNETNELFETIFTKQTTFQGFSEYLSKILTTIQTKLLEFTEQNMFQLDFEQLYNIHLTTNKLRNQIEEQGIDISLPIFFRLLQKVLMGLKIPFEGEPVKGLQIMGFLETRNLDFENVILLSANDENLPAGSASPSFIPYSIRQVFNMPTPNQNDAIYAYYFYRLIQRAKNVILIYNSASIGMSTGAKSRFLQQLLYNKDFNIKEEEQNYKIGVNIPEPLQIEKKGIVKEKLLEFLKPDSNLKLSPSAITTYMRCPIDFYYKYILGLREPDEVTDMVDARLFGSIFHNSAELLYKPYKGSKVTITKDTLQKIKNDKEHINKIIEEAFSITFLGEKHTRDFNIQGKNLLVKNVIKKYLLQMLEIDSKLTPFTIIGIEKRVSHKFKFKANNKDYSINIGGIIDRLDFVNNQLRIIDYKTGGDELKFKSIDEVFDKKNIDKKKAILQTFIYSLICAEIYPDKTNITSGLYKTKELFSPRFNWQISCSDKNNDFTDNNILNIKETLMDNLQNILAEIFDFSIPFEHSEDESSCPYCSLI